MRNLPVWENHLQIAKFQGLRTSLSEGPECVENTGFESEIAFDHMNLAQCGKIAF